MRGLELTASLRRSSIMQRHDSPNSVPDSSPRVIYKARKIAIIILVIGLFVAFLSNFIMPRMEHPPADNPQANSESAPIEGLQQ
jgi:hypothetical protein